MPFFDGHLDLAYLALEGRTMSLPLRFASGGPSPAAITFPALIEGGVTACFGTIFTGPGLDGPAGYPADDARAARMAGLKQLAVYQQWEELGLIRIVRTAADLDGPAGPLRVVLLMEGGDPIRDAVDVAWWYGQGLRAVGLAWSRGTRYAGGNDRHGGLTPQGREVVAALEEVGIIHDLSHLADGAAEQLLEGTAGPVMASHSNARALMGGVNQRHLSDALVRAIGARRGVIGVNLYSRFLTDGPERATIGRVVDHIEHLASTAGAPERVGLGTDMDGGFGADALPKGIDQPSDLRWISRALQECGWSAGEVGGFESGNWRAFLERVLPAG